MKDASFAVKLLSEFLQKIGNPPIGRVNTLEASYQNFLLGYLVNRVIIDCEIPYEKLSKIWKSEFSDLIENLNLNNDSQKFLSPLSEVWDQISYNLKNIVPKFQNDNISILGHTFLPGKSD